MSSKVVREKSKFGFLSSFLKWFYLIFFLFITLVPIIWLIITSFKSNLEFETASAFSLPEVWKFSNYANAINMSGLPRLFLNSIIVAVCATAVNLIVSSMGAFAIAREKFKFNNLLLSIIMAGVLVPIIALMVPYFRLINNLHLIDNLGGLIIVYAAINLPISVYLIHGFMSTIPKELEEAATIDGCTFAQRFTKVVFPLSQAGLATAGVLMFIYCWNEFTYAMLLTNSVRARTLQLGIRYFKSQFVVDYTSMLAAIVITMIPTIVVYIFMHDQIIGGMTNGAVKG
ncbi:MAG: carbohydrate ABC transporter permease [Pleomorphochaeta sp.]